MIKIKKYYCYYNPEDGKYYMNKNYKRSNENNINYLRQAAYNSLLGKSNINLSKNGKDSIPRRPNIYTLRVNVYFIGFSEISRALTERLNRDISRANEVWNKCNIRIEVANNGGQGEAVPTRNFVSSELGCYTDGTRQEEFEEFALANTQPFGISIFYVQGDELSDGRIGCGNPFFRTNGSGQIVNLQGIITLALDTTNSPYTLAHEIGHCLFFDKDTLNNNNPSLNYQTPDKQHDTRPTNFIYDGEGSPLIRNGIDGIQCQVSRRSLFFSINRGPIK